MKLSEKVEIIKRDIKPDSRGYFLKVLSGKENGIGLKIGEIYFALANPGESRGGHYHIKASEWFTVISGSAILWLEDVITKEKLEIRLEANNPLTVMVPPGIAHVFVNKSTNPFLLHAYSNLQYDTKDTILYGLDTL